MANVEDIAVKKHKKQKTVNSNEDCSSENDDCSSENDMQETSDASVSDVETTEKIEDEGSEEDTEQEPNSVDNVDVPQSSPVYDFGNHKIKSRTIIVENLPPTINQEQISSFFSRYGVIQSVCVQPIASEKQQSATNCLILFTKRENALAALEVNGMKLGEHRLRVDIHSILLFKAHRNAVLVTNLPAGATEEELWLAFEECGPVRSVTLSEASAVINFELSESVTLALKNEKFVIQDQQLCVKKFDNGPWNPPRVYPSYRTHYVSQPWQQRYSRGNSRFGLPQSYRGGSRGNFRLGFQPRYRGGFRSNSRAGLPVQRFGFRGNATRSRMLQRSGFRVIPGQFIFQ